jgi:hypothetical protein
MKKIIITGLIGCLIPMSVLAIDNIKKCTGCHGEKFEKKALNSSKIVSEMSEAEIVSSLEGYKKGTYGGKLKAIMTGQASGIEDIKSLAKEIYSKSRNIKSELNKTKCEEELNKLSKCVKKAKTNNEMDKCKDNLLDLAKKIENARKISF